MLVFPIGFAALAGVASAAEIPLADGEALEVGLTAQIRATLQSDASPAGALTLHRLRPVLGARLADGALVMRTQLNLTPGVAELLDVWAQVGKGPVTVRAGQLKTPFTLYRARSFSSMVLTDWAISPRAFGNERQLGLQVRGRADGLSATAGMFAGRNQRAAHRVRLAQLYERTGPNPSALVDPGPVTTRVAPEVFVRVARLGDGLDPTVGRDRTGDAPLRAGIGGSLAVNPRPEPGVDFGARAALEGLLQGRGIGVVTAAYTSLAPVGEGGWAPALSGGLVEVDVRVVSGLHVAARGAATAVHPPVQEEAPAAFAWETEVGAGLSVFGPGSLLVQGEVSHVGRRGPAPSSAAIARLQLQVAL